MEARFLRHPQGSVFWHDQVIEPTVNHEALVSNCLDILTDTTPDAAALVLAAIQAGREFRVLKGPAPAIAQPQRNGAHFHCMTSGTTGQPKAICRSHASWIGSFEVNKTLFDLGPNTRVAAFGKLGHSLALYAMIESVHLGAQVYLLDGMRPDKQLLYLDAAEIDLVYATPSQLRQLCRVATATSLPFLKYIVCGGGALEQNLKSALAGVFPNAQFVEFYGASETSFVTMSDRRTPVGSVGRPYPEVTIEIGDPDKTGIGVIWVNSPYLFAGYSIGGDQNTEFANGYVTVGELGRIDENGYLYVAGRKKRMVSIADQNVYPEAVEKLILDSMSITECAVFSLPDATRGSILCVALTGTKDLGLERDVKSLLRGKMGPTLAPKRFYYFDSLPKTDSGKINLDQLAAMVAGAK